jgi:alpha-beta hydrolase superfamily lysophospholipase
VSFDSCGSRCAATVYRPDGVAGPLACVVMGHGGTLTRRDGIPEFAEWLVGGGFAVLAFDYRHWGDSDGEPRRWLSVRRQLEDWRAALEYACGLESVDPERIAVWGMSLGGGHVLMMAAGDSRIVATIALAPMVDGLAQLLRTSTLRVRLAMTWRALRGALRRSPVILPVAGPSKSFALLAAPEALPGFRRLASASGWCNEVDMTGALHEMARYRPVRRASRIQSPVLFQLGERDRCVSLGAIEKAAARAQRAELVRYPVDHFGCFWPEHIERIANDELDFLQRHLVAAGDPAKRATA